MQCQLIEALFDVIGAFRQEEGLPRDYGGGVLLHHAELRLLDAVAGHPEQSASALAGRLGVTRGALTQTARRMMDKGLIEQYAPPRNRKVKYHRLTTAGEEARRGHARHHAGANERMRAYLRGLSPAEKQGLLTFLKTLKGCMPICLYECDGTGCACGITESVALD